jgi:hypothetical protein
MFVFAERILQSGVVSLTHPKYGTKLISELLVRDYKEYLPVIVKSLSSRLVRTVLTANVFLNTVFHHRFDANAAVDLLRAFVNVGADFTRLESDGITVFAELVRLPLIDFLHAASILLAAGVSPLNIDMSKSTLLHLMASQGLLPSYRRDATVPAELHQAFDDVLRLCRAKGAHFLSRDGQLRNVLSYIRYQDLVGLVESEQTLLTNEEKIAASAALNRPPPL